MLSSLGGLFTSIHIFLTILLGYFTKYMFQRSIAETAKEQYPDVFPESVAVVVDKIMESATP